MKNTLKKLMTLLLTAALIAAMFCIPVAASSVNEFQKSVIWIVCEIEYKATNLDFSFTESKTGTGFAIGEVGKPIQYIATCNHVVSGGSGILELYMTKDESSNYTVFGYSECPEGTEKVLSPIYDSDEGCYIMRDYFAPESITIAAVYSNSENDYVTMNLIAKNEGSDVAICKISSDPTTKISALPLRLEPDVKIGDTVYAIGYPGISYFQDSEARYDAKSSTVTRGIISNKQLTNGGNVNAGQYYIYGIDANIAGGNSGGPLITEDGYVVGINAGGFVDKSVGKSADYAVSINELVKLMDANRIPYSISAGMSWVIWLIIGVVVLLGIVVVVIVVARKKNTPVLAAEMPASQTEMDFSVQPQTASVPQNGKCYIIGMDGVMKGRKFALTDLAVIGRDPARCNIVFPADQPGVSSVHCEIRKTVSGITVSDLGSSYGTYLGKETRLTPNVPVSVRSGDIIWVGEQKNCFEIQY